MKSLLKDILMITDMYNYNFLNLDQLFLKAKPLLFIVDESYTVLDKKCL